MAQSNKQTISALQEVQEREVQPLYSTAHERALLCNTRELSQLSHSGHGLVAHVDRAQERVRV